MPLGRTHRDTHIPTCKPKKFQETRHVQPKAVRAWFKKFIASSRLDRPSIKPVMKQKVMAIVSVCAQTLPATYNVNFRSLQVGIQTG